MNAAKFAAAATRATNGQITVYGDCLIDNQLYIIQGQPTATDWQTISDAIMDACTDGETVKLDSATPHEDGTWTIELVNA